MLASIWLVASTPRSVNNKIDFWSGETIGATGRSSMTGDSEGLTIYDISIKSLIDKERILGACCANTGRERDKSATTTADTVNHRTTLPDFATQSLATDRRLPRIGALVILPVSKRITLEREHSESKFLCEGSCQRVTRFNTGFVVRIELLVRLGPSEAHRLNTRH